MFFVISKILSFLTDPFFWIIILFLLALFAKKKYKRRKYLVTGFVSLFIFSNTFLYGLFFSLWEIENVDLKEKYDYGILLGGIISLNSSSKNIEFNSTSDRLLKTIELYHINKIDKIIISGASGSLMSDLIEADYIKKYLINTGIPNKDILTETKSKNTYENAILTTKLIKRISSDHEPKCLLITSDYHMRRSLKCFKKTGLSVDPYVIDLEKKYFNLESIIIPQSHVLWEWKKLTHEFVGYAVYKFAGYL